MVELYEGLRLYCGGRGERILTIQFFNSRSQTQEITIKYVTEALQNTTFVKQCPLIQHHMDLLKRICQWLAIRDHQRFLVPERDTV